MASVTYGKCYSWQRYYGKCYYGKDIMANETEQLRTIVNIKNNNELWKIDSKDWINAK